MRWWRNMMSKQDSGEKIKKIINNSRLLLENEKYLELYDESYLYDFNNTLKSLKENLNKEDTESRKLVIGVVGAVKAGKSSFLNALIFDGEQYLPRAVTPSTATLTTISYSEKPEAVVHFFSKDEWDNVEELASKYEQKINYAYSNYISNIKEEKKDRRRQNKKINKKINNQQLSKEEFEKKYARSIVKDEKILSAIELREMATQNNVLHHLGGNEIIIENIIERLNDFIDAKGKFTAIVKNVELKVDNEKLKDIEIVDTPGLSDPIVSRGEKTKEELFKCDVVFLLSSVSEFLPADTMRLMSNSLPSKGVKEIIVVGSRFDDGITDEKEGDFLEIAKKTKLSCEKIFEENMKVLKTSYVGGSEALQLIKKSDRVYVSSMCYVLSKKLKQGDKLNAEEAKVYEQLQAYDGFKKDYLSLVSGMNDVKKKLNAIIQNKEEIKAKKDSELFEDASRNFAKILFDIKTYVETNNIKLKNMTKEEIEDRAQKINDALIMSRNQMKTLFETTGTQCEKRLIETKSVLTQEMANYTSFKVTTDHEEDVRTVGAGFLWLRKDVIKTDIETKKASTAQVKINFQNYGARSMQIINDEFKYLFDQERFIRRIKEIIMQAFEAGGTNYDEEDILLPIQKLLVKLTLQDIDVDINKYIDLLNTRYNRGFAENDEIHELRSIQAEYLGKIKDDYCDGLNNNGKTISKIMQTESIGFAEQLEKKFDGDKQTILVHMDEQEKYIELNAKFAAELGEYIKGFREIANAI